MSLMYYNYDCSDNKLLSKNITSLSKLEWLTEITK